jgi:hypothetical protein
MSPNPPSIPLAEHELVLARLDALRDLLLELVAKHDDKQFVSAAEQKLWARARALVETT